MKSVLQLGCVSQDSDAVVSQGGKSRRNQMQISLGTNSKGTIHLVCATSCECPGKERTIVGKNKCQRSSSAKSLRYEIWGQVPWRDRTTAAMCPKQGLTPCQNIYKRKEKDRAAFYFPAEEWVLLAASSKEPEEREFVVDSRASMHVVSMKNTFTLLGWRPWDIEESDNGDDGQRRGANQRRSDGVCQSIGLTRRSYASVLSLGKLCEDHGYTYHWISGQKPHLIKEGQENWLQYIELCTICGSWNNSEFFLYYALSASSSSSLQESTSANRDSVSDNRGVETPVSERSGGTNEELQPKTNRKMGNSKKYKELYRMNWLIGCRNPGRIWLMKILQKSVGETRWRRLQTHPSHLMNLQWSSEHTWNLVRVSTVYLRTSRRTQIVISALRRK